jgi:SOS-response transcriptional repressor LexA
MTLADPRSVADSMTSPVPCRSDSSRSFFHILDLWQPNRYRVYATGDRFAREGILNGDVLIADAFFTPYDGLVAVLQIQERLLTVRLELLSGKWCIKPKNMKPAKISDPPLEVWAVIKGLVRMEG